MDLAAEIRKVWPDAAAAQVGRHRVIRYANVTPAHTFEVVVAEVGGRPVELTARDSYDERLAAFLIDRAAELDPPSPRAIRVLPAEYPTPWTFNTIVIVPPLIARRFEGQSEILAEATYWVVPAFDGEFADGAGRREFWHQVRRTDGWRSDVIRWDRTRKTRPEFD